MRILHVVPSYLPATRYGGPIYSVHGLCKALAIRGHEVHVFTTNVDGDGASEVPLAQPVDLDGVKVWYFPSRRLRRLYFAPDMKRALVRETPRFEIVHLHSAFLWPTWAAARIARWARVPYLLAPRGMLVPDLVRRKSRWLKTAWIQLIEKRNLQRAAAIHVTAPLEREEIEKFGFALPSFIEVPNGIEPPETDVIPNSGDDQLPSRPYVLFLGRVNWKKGLDRLLRAWPQVRGADLIVAGNDEDQYQPELERLAQQEGISDRVCFMGSVTGHAKWALYRGSELFVLPSYSENFGTVVLEAMAMACPVLVTPEVGLAEMVLESGCGEVVDGTPQQMANTINRLLAETGERRQMGENGKARIARDFLWPSIACQMESHYMALVERHGCKTCL